MVALLNIHTAAVDGVPAKTLVEVEDPVKAARMLATKLFVDASKPIASTGARLVMRSTADDDEATAAAARDREARNAVAREMIDGAVGRNEPPPSADDMRRAIAEIERLRALVKTREDELAVANKHVADQDELLDETGAQNAALAKRVADLEAKTEGDSPKGT